MRLMSRGLPTSIDPFLKVRALGSDGGVEAVPRKDDRVIGKRKEQFIDRGDNRVEIPALILSGAWASREEGVASEEQRCAIEVKRDRPWRVPGVVNCVKAK